MKKKYLPFLLTAAIIVVDQITKALVVAYIPENTVKYSLFWDFLRIVHVRNDAVAFSMGSGLEVPVKLVLFILLPLALMVLLIYTLCSRKYENEFTTVQRYCIAGIIGGGIGNLIDRIFRHLRVVDFISTDMYGFLGFDRFPTYNVADASVVVSVILLIITILFTKKDKTNE